MTPEQMGHLFEPLFTTKRGGTGLGLAISYQLVSRVGGHIFVESQVGKGTIFHLMIPATHPALPAGERTDRTLPVRHVLIVEDEPAVAAGLEILLEIEGVTATTVTTGAEAVPAIERLRPDAVVLDIGLPDCDGAAVYEAIAERWPSLPVLFSSGQVQSERLRAHLERRNTGILIKPYDFEQFRQAICSIMSVPPEEVASAPPAVKAAS